MNVSGTLHLYSGSDREMFFVFDDDVAQQVKEIRTFNLEEIESRKIHISVGPDRFIRKRAITFTRKQTEIKVYLCRRSAKSDLGALTTLYDWFAPDATVHPEPVGVLGSLTYIRHRGWELHIQEPVDLDLTPPAGTLQRPKKISRTRKQWLKRRSVQERDLKVAGRKAEELAHKLAMRDFPEPRFRCLWRDTFLDSEILSLRPQEIIADIDVWNEEEEKIEVYLEIKAQKITGKRVSPLFYLSKAEKRSFEATRRLRIPYRIWLFQ